MKSILPAFVILAAAVVFSCKKTHTGTTGQALSPATAESYLTGQAWAFTYHPWQAHAAIWDSVGFFFLSQTSPNEFYDSIVAYYPLRLKQTTEGRFIVTNVYNAPDTLISLFSPYTAAFNQLDTFLITGLSPKQFVMQRYSGNFPPGYVAQKDTLTRQ